MSYDGKTRPQKILAGPANRVKPPGSPTAPGKPNDVAWDEDYVYFYISERRKWARVALATEWTLS